jgi:murein L,D-transpeptidase YcbB/YkuD
MIGKGTLAALNKTAVDEVPLILVNMEKWRWMPRSLGSFYVKVNIPEFTVDIVKDGAIQHTTRIVVGQVSWQTPIFSDEIEHVVVNPSWSVPPGIIAKELLPQLQSNPGAIRGYEVYAKVKGRFRQVSPGSINWSKVGPKDVQFRQPPGERNALGQVKFMFPNKYSVYLHDTPSKALFKQAFRAYSHGCMRVMDPWEFADALLVNEDWNSKRLKKLVGGPERRVDLKHHVPVHITYFTAWVDADGNLQTAADVYGHDKKIGAMLAGAPAG